VRILAVANQKGGVGKTTTSVNLAASLVATKRRVLLIDIDPQGNATTGSGIDKRTPESSIYDVLIGAKSAREVLISATSGGYDLLPANQRLAGAEIELVSMENRETRLKQALTGFAEHYDFVLIDCPPALSLLTVNAFCAAHAVVIPLQCEYYALEGLSDLVVTVKRIRASLNPRLEIEGLLRTMFDARSTLATQVSNELRQHFGEKVYRTIIPRNVRLAEAPSHGLPIIAYDLNSKGSQAYLALAGEILGKAAETA